MRLTDNELAYLIDTVAGKHPPSWWPDERRQQLIDKLTLMRRGQ